MYTLKELIEIIKLSLDIYADIAEGNGQDGDIGIYEEMIKEHKIITEFCLKIETNYIQNQYIDRIKITTLLDDENEEVKLALGYILEGYNNNLEWQNIKINEKRNKISTILGSIH